MRRNYLKFSKDTDGNRLKTISLSGCSLCIENTKKIYLNINSLP